MTSAGSPGETASQPYKQIIKDMLIELNQALDPHVVVKVARKVQGLKISDTLEVEALDGDPQTIVQGLVDEFVGLSNQVVVRTLQPLLKQCPWIKLPGVNTQ